MTTLESALISELGEKLVRNEPLKNHVQIRVGGVADYFYVADSLSDLAHSVSLAHSLGLPYIVLGGGTNVIPSDGGFPGLVIKNMSSNIMFSPESSTVIVDSGVVLSKLINLAAGRDLGGLEFLVGVPGTVGGSLYNNAGDCKDAIGDRVRSITLLMPKDGRVAIVKHDPSWMHFSSFSSILKEWEEKESRPVLLTATLQLAMRRKDEILRLIHFYNKQHSLNYPSEGFVTGEYFKPISLEPVVMARSIIDLLPTKRIKSNTVCFAKENHNCLVNRKGAMAKELREVADAVKALAKEEKEIILEEMVEYIGRW